MDPTQAAMAELTKWLFDALFSSTIGQITTPFATIFLLLRFINWTRATAKGETAGSLHDDMGDVRNRAGEIGDRIHRAQGNYGPYPNRPNPRQGRRRRP